MIATFSDAWEPRGKSVGWVILAPGVDTQKLVRECFWKSVGWWVGCMGAPYHIDGMVIGELGPSGGLCTGAQAL